ncbi:ADP-ribosylglycohydrolase family protein [Pleionea sp. CnH1-48]|uniref:ADP-ribosylglycohydrolase family protein n=1 Tax=Pleionea sp. CnH1-48 TaxID=2954494 RepID=UPI0020982867|nr:ADP-ribosylglycohydrolase family protein [Pleionea sp. CnH1-48]MCO7226732.1 ADP-ribosylglycohydrolase family protein [Pleionea sp. CnH1-48]
MKDNYRGCLVGLAVGDALGTTLEFKPRGSFTPLTDMIGGGPFALAPGQWTDDTSMALCLAHSLLHKNGFDACDQMNRYCNWWQYGYMSSTNECFDIGMTVQQSLMAYQETGDPFSGPVSPDTAGNGCLMRLAPIPMFYGDSYKDTLHFSGESSRTTHGTLECIDASRFFGTLLFRALHECDKQSLLQQSGYEAESESVSNLVNCGYQSKSEHQITGSGYVIHSLEAALWCFATTTNFADAVLAAANLGDDADTTAAICGQLAGAYYGMSNIPRKWLAKLHQINEIKALSDKLLQSAQIQRQHGGKQR